MLPCTRTARTHSTVLCAAVCMPLLRCCETQRFLSPPSCCALWRGLIAACTPLASCYCAWTHPRALFARVVVASPSAACKTATARCAASPPRCLSYAPLSPGGLFLTLRSRFATASATPYLPWNNTALDRGCGCLLLWTSFENKIHALNHKHMHIELYLVSWHCL